MPSMRQQSGDETWPVWRVHRVQQLSNVQICQTEDDWGQVSGMLGRRSGRAAVETGEDVLRLQPLSRLQFRDMVKTRGRKVSGLRQPLHDREMAEGRSGSPMPQPGM